MSSVFGYKTLNYTLKERQGDNTNRHSFFVDFTDTYENQMGYDTVWLYFML